LEATPVAAHHASVVDLTDDGTVVGYASPTGGDPAPYGPFVWRADRGVTFLPQPPDQPIEARAANDRGAVVGHLAVPRPDTGSVDFQAYIWTAGRGMEVVDDVHPFSTAVAVNDHGVVAGSFGAGDGTEGAFRWSATRGLEILASLGGGRPQPSAIDERGVVAGTITTPDGTDRVVTWTGTAPTDIGTIGQGHTTVARNDRDTIAGTYLNGTDGARRAYRWTSRTGFEDLAFPEPGTTQQVAGINDRGVIAVTAGTDVLGQVVGDVHLWLPTAATH
jgi:hypothetical protein